MDGIQIDQPSTPIPALAVNEFVNDLMKLLLKEKNYICQALEIPRLPFISYDYIDRKIMAPMRWGVTGTLEASRLALEGNNCWNLAGGYHHASQHSAEGFCIYNDVGISYQELKREKRITEEDRILIIDVDVHHGNGNARTFKDNKQITLLDVYNEDIYPMTWSTRNRVDIAVPLSSGTRGDEYLSKLEKALSEIDTNYKLVYVVAGTDVISEDRLGRLNLSIENVVERDKKILAALTEKSIPAVFLGGGGYSKESATAITKSICELYQK
jgi:histone deacetylase 11